VARWEFGDGTEVGESSINVSHAYEKAGTYTPALYIAEGNGREREFRIKDYIEVK